VLQSIFHVTVVLLPAQVVPRDTVVELLSNVIPSGRVIFAMAFCAGYCLLSNGLGHGYLIFAVTVIIDPDVALPFTLRSTDHGIIATPK